MSDQPEVVGPSDMLYLNQIATFRLARSEVKQQLKLAGGGRRPRHDGQGHDTAQREQIPITASISEHLRVGGVPSRVHQTSRAPNDQENLGDTSDFWSIAIPSSNIEPVTQRGSSVLPLDEEQYLRMAEEISSYMTWDGWYQSGTDYSTEYNTAQLFGVGNGMDGI